MAFRFWLLTILAVQSAAVRFGVDLANGKAHGQPPFKKSDRIAIVGAGPAGVHMASRLKQMGYTILHGYTKTVLFERSDRVGGKSLIIYMNDTSECAKGQDRSGGQLLPCCT
jgi:NADPH-dependent glutamate synthase beta subunit-like oxidoreductase